VSERAEREPTCVSLFSGVGALDEGLRRAGFRHVLLCESDSYRRDVLRARFPGVPVADDVREVFVKRAAWNKGQSYTFAKREVYANKGTWSAAMHRMFPPACMSCGWDKAKCDIHHIVPRRDGGEMTLGNGIILCPNCHRLTENGSFTAAELRTIRDLATPIGERIGAVMPSEAAQIDLVCGGFPERARTSRSPDDEPDSTASEAVFSSSWRESSTLFDPDLFSWKTFRGVNPRTLVGTSESLLARWPNSGLVWPTGFSTAVSSECRSDEGGCSSSEPSLTEILEPPQNVPARYSLSARAATGILRRAEKRGKRLPAHLATALVSVAGQPISTDMAHT